MSIYKGTQLIAGVQTVVDKSERIGQIIQSTIPLVDAGLHLLDGALIDGNGIYSDFVDYISNLDLTANYFCTEAEWQQSVTNYGVCGKFVYNSTNNTLRLPKITGFIEGTNVVSDLGDLVEAGLPNFSGTFRTDYADTTGNLTYVSQTFSSGIAGTTSSNTDNIVTIDLSNASSIYGNSNTVQPQSVKVYYYIVVATSTKTAIQVDIDEIATDLNGKADVDLTNVNNAGTSKSAGWAMPSNTYKNLTLGSSGTSYTAPANGWFYFSKNAGASGKYISIKNSTACNMQTELISNASNNVLHTYLPVSKGDTVIVEYDATGTTNLFRFIYAQGSESEAS